MTVHPHGDGILSTEGVPLNVTGVAQFKIRSDDDGLKKAAEQFLERSTREIKDSVLQTLEGHLRAILGKFRVLQISLFSYVGACQTEFTGSKCRDDDMQRLLGK